MFCFVKHVRTIAYWPLPGKTYLDPQAEFLFVPVGHKPLPEGAEPFDIPGVRLSHQS